MNKMFVVLLAVSLSACSGPSKDEIEVASKACREFIAENMSVSENDTKIFDVWSKNSAIVLDVGYKENFRDTSYSVRKCVYDEKKGTISSPSPLNDSEWNK